MHRTFAALQRLHTLDENLRCSTALVLLAVSNQHPRGITSAQLQADLSMTQASVARAVLRLSCRGSKSHSVGPPLNLITLEPDPTAPKRALARLSPAGEQLLSGLGLR